MRPNPEIMAHAMELANNPQAMMDFLFASAVEVLPGGGNILEVGTHRGGSALVFMDALAQMESNAFLTTVDPWGGRPYPGSLSRYDDNDQRIAMRQLSNFAFDHKLNWHHFKMPSLDFLQWPTQRPCWYGNKWSPYFWSLAFLDGEHIIKTVLDEIRAVKKYMSPGGRILVDNANHRQPEEESEYKGLIAGPPKEPGGPPEMKPVFRHERQMTEALKAIGVELGLETIFHPFEGDVVCEFRGF